MKPNSSTPRMLANMKFIGNLFLRQLLAVKVIGQAPLENGHDLRVVAVMSAVVAALAVAVAVAWCW